MKIDKTTVESLATSVSQLGEELKLLKHTTENCSPKCHSGKTR